MPAPQDMHDSDGSRPSRVRHYVLAVHNLDAVAAELYEFLGLDPSPPHDGPSPTEALGFETSMLQVGTTLIELVQPIRDDHLLHRWFDKRGGRDGGYMVVMQTYDAPALRARAAAAGVELVMDFEFRGQQLMQFNHRDFGTRFEFYLYTPEDDWWGSPLTREYPVSSVAEEVVGATVAVDDPAATARRASAVFLAEHVGDAIACVDERRIDFVANHEPELPGLVEIRVRARDRDRAGAVARIAEVDFRLV